MNQTGQKSLFFTRFAFFLSERSRISSNCHFRGCAGLKTPYNARHANGVMRKQLWGGFEMK
jgi:hypothetical protein